MFSRISLIVKTSLPVWVLSLLGAVPVFEIVGTDDLDGFLAA